VKGRILVELVDPWHEPGYRIEVPVWQGETIEAWAVTDWSEEVDPVTRRRPSDRRSGVYVHRGLSRRDGTPVFVWEPPR